MEWVYTVLCLIALAVAGLCIVRSYWMLGFGSGSKRTFAWLGASMVFLLLAFVAMSGVQSERDKEDESQKREVQAMGFSAVIVDYTNNAEVKLRSECPNRDLLLYKRGDLWYVGTEEIDSSKPVVSESEVALRPEVKWWCSKPPIKN